jgi:hypothetical protein
MANQKKWICVGLLCTGCTHGGWCLVYLRGRGPMGKLTRRRYTAAAAQVSRRRAQAVRRIVLVGGRGETSVVISGGGDRSCWNIKVKAAGQEEGRAEGDGQSNKAIRSIDKSTSRDQAAPNAIKQITSRLALRWVYLVLSDDKRDGVVQESHSPHLHIHTISHKAVRDAGMPIAPVRRLILGLALHQRAAGGHVPQVPPNMGTSAGQTATWAHHAIPRPPSAAAETNPVQKALCRGA